MGKAPLSQEEIDALLAGVGSEGKQAESPLESHQEQGRVMAQPVEFEQMPRTGYDQVDPGINIGLIMDIPVEVTVELGRTRRLVKEVLAMTNGSVVELDRQAGEPVDILVNGKLLARGEVVVIDENFGVRISEIVSKPDRLDGVK